MQFLKCPESIQIDSRTIRACSGVESWILEAFFGGEKLGISKKCEIANFRHWELQICKFGYWKTAKLRTCEIENSETGNCKLQVRKFGNLQNCECAKLKFQKLQIANLKIQKLETAHMGDLDVLAFGIPGGEGFAPLLRRKAGVHDVV